MSDARPRSICPDVTLRAFKSRQSTEMGLARRLSRVSGIAIEGYVLCGGRLKTLARSGESELIVRLRAHREKSAVAQPQLELILAVERG